MQLVQQISTQYK